MKDLRILLQPGYIVKIGNGNTYVIGFNNRFLRKGHWLEAYYNKDLTYRDHDLFFNIVKIYKTNFTEQLYSKLKPHSFLTELPLELYSIFDQILIEIQRNSLQLTTIYPVNNYINIF